MKIRKGLVSNSSSSSFLIACDTKEKLILLNLVLRGLPNRGRHRYPYIPSEVTTIKELRLWTDREIENLEKDISVTEEKLKLFNSLKTNKIAQQAIMSWLEIEPSKTKEYSIEGIQYTAKIEDEFQRMINGFSIRTKSLKKKISDLAATVKDIDPKLLEDSTVLLLDIDSYDRSAFEEGFKALNIQIIEKLHG